MSIILDGITLPDDLEWLDEFEWSPVAQTRDHSIGGSLMVQEGTKLKGRPITLTGGEWAWVTRLTVKNLFAILTADHTMTLTLEDGRTFSVMWDHSDKPITATPVKFQAPPDDADEYFIELKLFEVTP